jgi:DNA-binding beta-propeller fold protein YncE
VDEQGYAWVADARNDRIQVFNPAGDYVSKFGSAGSGEGQFNTDWWLRLTLADGDLLVVDQGNSRSASACTAVGFYKTGSEAFSTLAMRWNGSSWAIVSTPNPGWFAKSHLYDVACPAAADCWAVGKAKKAEAKIPPQ